MTLPTLLRSPQTFLSENIRVMDGIRVQQYFSDYGEEEMLQVRKFWQSYASRKDLIDFGSRRTQIRYSYNPSTMSYYRQVRNLRRQRVPYHYIKLDVTRFANNICQTQRQLAQLLFNGTASAQEWYDSSIRMMKYTYRAAFDIARGSSGAMSVEEEREFLRVSEEEIGKFNVYAQRVAGGDVPLDGRVLNAACSLGKGINTLFENWKLWLAKKNGYTQARRRLTFAEHCRDSEQRYGCVELARRGWQNINVITPIGGATCWNGCLCEMEYR